MSLSADLLAQARLLATKEPRRPLQASLRRAVSASYYSIFHLLVADGTRRMVPGSDHSTMQPVARQFAARNVSPRLASAFGGKDLQDELVSVAAAFVDLQQQRHEADYDVARSFTRAKVPAMVGDAERAAANWQQVRRSVQADAFLIGLFAFDRMRA